MLGLVFYISPSLYLFATARDPKLMTFSRTSKITTENEIELSLNEDIRTLFSFGRFIAVGVRSLYFMMEINLDPLHAKGRVKLQVSVYIELDDPF